MANRYGEAALMAARGSSAAGVDPVVRWESAMEKLYPTSPTARKKGCPRGAFLGLCEEGLVKGIPAGRYTESKDNKGYAVRAAALLAEGKQSWSTSSLWRSVTDDPEKVHSSQMDVVLALWNNDLIVGLTGRGGRELDRYLLRRRAPPFILSALPFQVPAIPQGQGSEQPDGTGREGCARGGGELAALHEGGVIEQAVAVAAGEAVLAVWKVEAGASAAALAPGAAEPRAAAKAGGMRDEVVSDGD